MPYSLYEQVVADNTVKTIADLNPPDAAVAVDLQADTNDIRYTMDGSAPAQAVGMILLTTEPPQRFLMDDMTAIRFTRGAAVNGNLNVHWIIPR